MADTTTAAPAAHDLITGGATARVEYVSGGDVYVVSPQGDRWSIPTEYLILTRPAVRGGTPAEWAESPAWTEAPHTCPACDAVATDDQTPADRLAGLIACLTAAAPRT